MNTDGKEACARIRTEMPTTASHVAAELRNAMVMVANAIEDMGSYDEDATAADLALALTHVLAVADALHPGGRVAS